MKFLSLLVILLAMVWTFQISTHQREVPLAVHGFIVRELKAAMSEYLQSHVAGVENITYHRLFTEIIEPGKQLKAFVKYSYESLTDQGQLTREVREGEFDLISADGGQTWEPTAKNFRDVNLEFLEGLRVVPDENTGDSVPMETSPSDTAGDAATPE